MTPPASSTLLFGIAIEATLWGAYVNILFCSLMLYFRRAEHERTSRPVLFMSCLLFVACTLHLMCGVDAVWTTANVGINAIKGSPGDVLVPLCNSIGLLMLVHRCWTLWQKQTWVIFPAGAAAVLGCALTSNFAYTPSEPDGVLNTIMSVLGHTLLLYSNLSTTPLIAAGLDRLSYALNHMDSTKEKVSFMSATAVLIECGLLHFLAQSVSFLFVVLQHPLKYAVAAGAVQIYGFSSAMGLVRTGLGHALGAVPDIDPDTIQTTPEEDEEAKALERAVLRAFDVPV